MPTTNCQGFMMKFIRPMDQQQYAQLILDIEEQLNDDLDAEERRYRVLPEKITEGAIHLVRYPGYEEGLQYKAMRHWIHDKPFHMMSPYPWPLIPEGTSVEEHLEDWLRNGAGRPFIPKGATSQTHLKARGSAPTWTLSELRTIANVLERYGALCTGFPKPDHLTMDYGPVRLLIP